MAMTVYSVVEVARHNSPRDLWMIIHGGVYDLTKFLQEHPGGEEVLLKLAGTDGTQCFDEMGHTAEAVQLRETFKIGEVTTGDSTLTNLMPNKEKPTVDDDNWKYEEPTADGANLKIFFFGILVLIYATIYIYFF